jgi:hypothetical protein
MNGRANSVRRFQRSSAATILTLSLLLTTLTAMVATAGDQAFIKELYRTRHTDLTQLAAIKPSMLKDIAP